MERRLLPALLLFTLSLAFQVRPRFMEDCPEVSDAKLGPRIPVVLVLQRVTECRPGSPSGWRERRRHPTGAGSAEGGHDAALDESVDRRLRDSRSDSHLTDREQVARLGLRPLPPARHGAGGEFLDGAKRRVPTPAEVRDSPGWRSAHAPSGTRYPWARANWIREPKRPRARRLAPGRVPVRQGEPSGAPGRRRHGNSASPQGRLLHRLDEGTRRSPRRRPG